MAVKELTADRFESIVEQGIVLVDMWAAWCGPCRAFAPVFEAASERHTDVVFAKLDTQAEQALARQLGIQAIPTLMAFRDGVLLYSQAGAVSGRAIDQLLAQIRALDMDAVRADVAARVGRQVAQR